MAFASILCAELFALTLQNTGDFVKISASLLI